MPKNHGMDIGPVIREIRLGKKLTLEEVAYASGTDGGNLSRIERGLQRCIPELLERIAGSLGIAVSELYLRAEQGAAGKTTLKQIPKAYPAAHEEGFGEQSNNMIAKYRKLNESNQKLVDELIQLLLRQQRRK